MANETIEMLTEIKDGLEALEKALKAIRDVCVAGISDLELRKSTMHNVTRSGIWLNDKSGC